MANNKQGTVFLCVHTGVTRPLPTCFVTCHVTNKEYSAALINVNQLLPCLGPCIRRRRSFLFGKQFVCYLLCSPLHCANALLTIACIMHACPRAEQALFNHLLIHLQPVSKLLYQDHGCSCSHDFGVIIFRFANQLYSCLPPFYSAEKAHLMATGCSVS